MFDKLLVAINNPQSPTIPPSVPPSPPSAIPPGSPPAPPEGIVDQVLAFIYASAHWLGGIIVNLLGSIVTLQSPEKLIDPIGYLSLLTLFLIVAEVAKKITWLIIIVGWVLIVIRIIMETKQI